MSPLNDILVYLKYLNFDLQPVHYIYTGETKDTTRIHLFVEDASGNKEVISGEKDCIQFFSDQTCIIHLKDKANDFVKNKFKPRLVRDFNKN